MNLFIFSEFEELSAVLQTASERETVGRKKLEACINELLERAIKAEVELQGIKSAAPVNLYKLANSLGTTLQHSD